MYQIIYTDSYREYFKDLSLSYKKRIDCIEEKLRDDPYSGRPLGYPFFREKKLNGIRVLFLIYEEHQCVYLVAITDKKHQQSDITTIKNNLRRFKEEIRNRSPS